MTYTHFSLKTLALLLAFLSTALSTYSQQTREDSLPDFILLDSLDDYMDLSFQDTNFHQITLKRNILNEVTFSNVQVRDTLKFWDNELYHFTVDSLVSKDLIISANQFSEGKFKKVHTENNMEFSIIECGYLKLDDLTAGDTFALKDNLALGIELHELTINGPFLCDFNEVRNMSIGRVRYMSEAQFMDNDADSGLTIWSCNFSRCSNLVFDWFEGKELSISYSRLPDTLTLKDIYVEEQIDLSLDNVIGENNEPCVLVLGDGSFDKLKLRYSNFELAIPEKLTMEQFEQYTYIFENLLNDHKERGYISSYEILDRDYQDFKLSKNPNDSRLVQSIGHFLSFVNNYWNGYGYEKERIWFNSFILISLFGFINWLIFPFLTNKVYPIQGILDTQNRLIKKKVEQNPDSRNFLSRRNPYLVFFYTCLIFFGLKITIENLKFDHKIAVAYIFLQYTVGLVCLAYMANFVISSSLIGA